MYVYEEQKDKLFTDEGQRKFLNVRDRVQAFLKSAGAFRAEEVFSGICVADSWTVFACIDRLVELGEIREVLQENAISQERIYTTVHCAR